MKRLLTVLLAGLLVAAIVLPAAAWEFSMTGEYEMRLRYVGRTGGTDLFGVASLQNDPVVVNAPNFGSVGFAGPNWYNLNRGGDFTVPGAAVLGATITDAPLNAGTNIAVRQVQPITAGYSDTGSGRARIVSGGYSTWGSDALYHDSRLTLRPVIRVNPAIRVHGVYTVGGMRHKWFQNYIGGYGAGIGTPPLERYYMHQTSMNAYDTAALGSWEQFRATIQLPLGIFSIGVKDFPFGTGASLAYNTRAEAWLTVLPYGPFRFLHGIWLARGRTQESWIVNPDKDNKPTLFQGILMTYDCGAFQFGAGTIYRLTHLNTSMTPPTDNGRDINDWINLAYFKYNNGHLFAAAEYAWANVDIYRLGATPVYVETYHFFSEVGAVAGPAKLRLMYALVNGLVRNNPNPTKSYQPWALNYQAMRPYQFLMFDTYAGGNNGGWSGTDVTFVSDDTGMMTDAYAFAGRLDYAVASNLNVWGSYIWAHRLERAGTFKGQYLSSGADATAAQRAAFITDNFGADVNPYVDDGYIGWEANAGLDWKLLENLNMHVQYSYWQPGDWFTQAYQAVGMVGGAVVANAAISGRDAIQAVNGSFIINF